MYFPTLDINICPSTKYPLQVSEEFNCSVGMFICLGCQFQFISPSETLSINRVPCWVGTMVLHALVMSYGQTILGILSTVDI